jgi:hypothetical protein
MSIWGKPSERKSDHLDCRRREYKYKNLQEKKTLLASHGRTNSNQGVSLGEPSVQPIPAEGQNFVDKQYS